jgi:hypothetical protein
VRQRGRRTRQFGEVEAYGLHDQLLRQSHDRSPGLEPAASPKQLDIMDFPEMLADRFQIHNVEVQQFHFLSPEPSYYRKFLDG